MTRVQLLGHSLSLCRDPLSNNLTQLQAPVKRAEPQLTFATGNLCSRNDCLRNSTSQAPFHTEPWNRLKSFCNIVLLWKSQIQNRLRNSNRRYNRDTGSKQKFYCDTGSRGIGNPCQTIAARLGQAFGKEQAPKLPRFLEDIRPKEGWGKGKMSSFTIYRSHRTTDALSMAAFHRIPAVKNRPSAKQSRTATLARKGQHSSWRGCGFVMVNLLLRLSETPHSCWDFCWRWQMGCANPGST